MVRGKRQDRKGLTAGNSDFVDGRVSCGAESVSYRIDRGHIMKRNLIFLSVLAALVEIAPHSVPILAPPAWAGCEAGDKINKTTVEETRALLAKAGYKNAHNWRKGCDNTWHVTATLDGSEVSVAVLPDGHVVREGD